MEEKSNAVEIQNLTKYYGRHRGVEDISFTVERGDIFGFLGPNGSGKSTTIRSMLGLLYFQKGNITILGQNIRRKPEKALEKIGYMPSEAMFYPSMKAGEVIQYAAKVRKKDCRKESDRLCRILEVDQEKRIRELSLGNRKKISIVCALQHKPDLLVMDEPTSGLDPLMQDVFFRLLTECSGRGATCFLSSHVLSEVKSYCRNAAIIREGRLIRQDTMENLTRSNIRKVKICLPDHEESFVYSGEMQELINRLSKMQVRDVLIEEPSLDEIFMHYYEGETENEHI